MSRSGRRGAPRHVAVVGGGVVGLAIAWRAAGRGMAVTVIDPAPGRGASWVAGGMLAPLAEAHATEPAMLRLGLASRDAFAGFAADLGADAGQDAGLSGRGTLVVARDGDDAAELDELGEVLDGFGVGVERVGSRAARRLEPALRPSLRGALWFPDDHQVDNRALVRALVGAAAARGVTTSNGRARRVSRDAVELEDGSTFAADDVVVCTGAWSVPVAVPTGEWRAPVRPVKGQILRVRASHAAVNPTRTVRGLDVYVIPRRGGEIAIGATSEDRGFDTTVTAGAVRELLSDAWELLPGLAEATFLEAAAGLRPATPDNLPLLGRLGTDGPLVAMGHYRHGVLLAPATADAVVALLEDRPAPVDLRPFAPDRFDRAGAGEVRRAGSGAAPIGVGG